MTHEEISRAVVEALANQAEMEIYEIGEDTDIASLGIDSLDLVETVMALEDSLDTEIMEGDMSAFKKVGDLVAEAERSLARTKDTAPDGEEQPRGTN